MKLVSLRAEVSFGGGLAGRLGRRAAFGALALSLATCALGCGRDEAPRERASSRTAEDVSRFPDSLGAFDAVGEPRTGVAEVAGQRLVSAERIYVERRADATRARTEEQAGAAGAEAVGREARLRIVDVGAHRALVDTFAVARRLEIDELDALTRPIRVADEPAVVQWTRETAESELQVLAGERYLVTLKVWPADRPDEALTLCPDEVVERLARAR